MKEEKLLLFLVLILNFNINECSKRAFSEDIEMADTKSVMNADISQQTKSIMNGNRKEYGKVRRKTENLEKRNKQESSLKWLLHQHDFKRGKETNFNLHSSNNALKRNPIKAHAKDSGSSALNMNAQEKQGQSKRITLWSLEGLSDDFPIDLPRLAADQGGKIGDEALPSLVRNIEPTDYRAYVQYRLFSETKGDSGLDFEKNKDHVLKLLANKKENDAINHVKRSTRNDFSFKSPQRNKKQSRNDRKYEVPVLKRKREIKKSDEVKQKSLQPPISNAAGTNESGLIEIEKEQELSEEAIKKEQMTGDASKKTNESFYNEFNYLPN